MSKGDVTYGGYLRLPELLACQSPRTGQHDEMLFVILHQTMELWLKQVIYEVSAAQMQIRAGALVPAYKGLARVSRIQAQMTLAWDVLATMTPADYLAFRHALGASSGFQSAQFREMEYRLGIKDASFLVHAAQGSSERAVLEAALAAPSLYDDCIAQLAGAGFALSADFLARDLAAPYLPRAEVEEAWLAVYRDTAAYWPLYQLGEKLMDLDDALLSWRHKHALTVERIIGAKRGTGGTEGVAYLKATLARRAFPELWTMRTRL
jgi:tryptophan 2,3-dioxygenase